MNTAATISQQWINAWKKSSFRIHAIVVICLLICLLIFIPRFLNCVQLRNGAVLNDPLLNVIGPVDVSWITFTLIYASIFISLIYLFKDPERLLLMLGAYCLLTVLRMTCIFFVPLNNPPGIIVLNDPFVAIVGYGDKIITKDLFFSGHVSTMFLLYLSANQKWLKSVLLIATILVGSLILLQHVHYSIDVLAAPLFSFLSFRCIKYMQDLIEKAPTKDSFNKKV